MIHVFSSPSIIQQYMLHPLRYLVIAQLRVSSCCQDNFRVYTPGANSAASRDSYCKRRSKCIYVGQPVQVVWVVVVEVVVAVVW